MKLDPTKMAGWQIAEAAEAEMKPVAELAREMGLRDDELIPMGRNLAKVDFRKTWDRLKDAPQGKYVDVTAITSTRLGEGKTTAVMGLLEGLARIGKRPVGAIRQPSSGPTFNIKGSAAGGGLAQCIPLAPFSLGLTGDLDKITNAHNLAMVALTARMQHERNYDDARLEQIGIRRLNIDPAKVQIKWAIDFCAQALRNITIGKGGKMDGVKMDSGFQITASSELMTILALATSLKDLRERIARMIVAYDQNDEPVTTADLEVDGAMTALMAEALNPTLVQTIEGQPVFVHAGPFANIAIGQSSVIADLLGIRLGDYLVTESGFATDIGYEKFWNLKCRASSLKPDAVVIVATIRSLKMHGGGPAVKPGQPLADVYTKEDLGLLEKGCCNLIAHINIVKRSGVSPVICLNGFYTDTQAEQDLVRRIAAEHGVRCAVSNHWEEGGAGAVELAEAVVEACEEESRFEFLYDLEHPIKERVERVAKKIYRAVDVSWSPEALHKLAQFDRHPEMRDFGVCMVKTHLSLSHNPDFKGCPTGWTLPIRDVLVYNGARFIVPVAGDINLLPGTGSNPGFRRIDVDTETGKITGLF